MNLTCEENGFVLELFVLVGIYYNEYKEKDLIDDRKYFVKLLEDIPEKTTRNVLKHKMYLEKQIREIDISLSEINSNQLKKALGGNRKGGNNSIINWMIYELSKFFITKKGTDWKKIKLILSDSKLNTVTYGFKIQDVVLQLSDPEELQIKRIKDRKRDWVQQCRRQEISPDIKNSDWVIIG